MSNRTSITTDNAVDVAFRQTAAFVSVNDINEYYSRGLHELRRALVATGHVKKVRRDSRVRYLPPDVIESSRNVRKARAGA